MPLQNIWEKGGGGVFRESVEGARIEFEILDRETRPT